MENIFNEYVDFITTDPRKNRPQNKFGSYVISAEFQFYRHLISLPPESIKGKKILDLGSCLSATGAWCLHHGAERYVGVEMQKKFCEQSEINLEKYFSGKNWEIKNQSLTEFFQTNQEKFDIVVAFGVIYQSVEVESTIRKICELNSDYVVIESGQPRLFDVILEQHQIQNTQLLNRLHKLPFIEYKNYHVVSEIEGYMLRVEGSLPSMSALKILMMNFGYQFIEDYTDKILEKYPENFSGRYNCIFKKIEVKPESVLPSFEENYNRKVKLITQYGGNPPVNWTLGSWSFDKNLAPNFIQHAEQHIPKYNEIIEQSAQICHKLISNKSEQIIDVGCATGKTIEVLYDYGFTNLIGVDNSQAMLDSVCEKDIAKYILSDTLPVGVYSAIICNWTLHFIKDKETYLKSMYDNLKSGGFLILTDKTKNSGIELKLYHDFKRNQGVSEEEIKKKAESLIGKMFIDSESWYFEKCREFGFKDVSIINAAPCFTTFIMFK